jgi:hypothetical protein
VDVEGRIMVKGHLNVMLNASDDEDRGADSRASRDRERGLAHGNAAFPEQRERDCVFGVRCMAVLLL